MPERVDWGERRPECDDPAQQRMVRNYLLEIDTQAAHPTWNWAREAEPSGP